MTNLKKTDKWKLSLYEIHRKPQESVDDEVVVTLSREQFTCPICLDLLKNTMTAKECLHRFCYDCITTALRAGNKECPVCRKQLASKRALRLNKNMDELIEKLFSSEDNENEERIIAEINKHCFQSKVPPKTKTKGTKSQHSSRQLTHLKFDSVTDGKVGSPSASCSNVVEEVRPSCSFSSDTASTSRQMQLNQNVSLHPMRSGESLKNCVQTNEHILSSCDSMKDNISESLYLNPKLVQKTLLCSSDATDKSCDDDDDHLEQGSTANKLMKISPLIDNIQSSNLVSPLLRQPHQNVSQSHSLHQHINLSCDKESFENAKCVSLEDSLPPLLEPNYESSDLERCVSLVDSLLLPPVLEPNYESFDNARCVNSRNTPPLLESTVDVSHDYEAFEDRRCVSPQDNLPTLLEPNIDIISNYRSLANARYLSSQEMLPCSTQSNTNLVHDYKSFENAQDRLQFSSDSNIQVRCTCRSPDNARYISPQERPSSSLDPNLNISCSCKLLDNSARCVSPQERLPSLPDSSTNVTWGYNSFDYERFHNLHDDIKDDESTGDSTNSLDNTESSKTVYHFHQTTSLFSSSFVLLNNGGDERPKQKSHRNIFPGNNKSLNNDKDGINYLHSKTCSDKNDSKPLLQIPRCLLDISSNCFNNSNMNCEQNKRTSSHEPLTEISLIENKSLKSSSHPKSSLNKTFQDGIECETQTEAQLDKKSGIFSFSIDNRNRDANLSNLTTLVDQHRLLLMENGSKSNISNKLLQENAKSKKYIQQTSVSLLPNTTIADNSKLLNQKSSSNILNQIEQLNTSLNRDSPNGDNTESNKPSQVPSPHFSTINEDSIYKHKKSLKEFKENKENYLSNQKLFDVEVISEHQQDPSLDSLCERLQNRLKTNNATFETKSTDLSSNNSPNLQSSMRDSSNVAFDLLLDNSLNLPSSLTDSSNVASGVLLSKSSNLPSSPKDSSNVTSDLLLNKSPKSLSSKRSSNAASDFLLNNSNLPSSLKGSSIEASDLLLTKSPNLPSLSKGSSNIASDLLLNNRLNLPSSSKGSYNVVSKKCKKVNLKKRKQKTKKELNLSSTPVIFDEIELMLKLRSPASPQDLELVKVLQGVLIKFIKTTANATIDHLSKYLITSLMDAPNLKLLKTTDLSQFQFYVLSSSNTYIQLNGDQRLLQIYLQYEKSGKPFEIHYSWRIT